MTPDSRTWPPYSLLGGLPPHERAALLRLGSVRSFDGGETVLVEGDRDSRDVYVLLDGVVKVVSNTEDGSAVVLSIRADGDLVGELAGLDGSPRLATVVAIRPLTTRRIGHQAFHDFLRTHPDTALAVSRSVSAKLRNATWHRVEYGSVPAPVRLARLLIQLATQHGKPDPDGDGDGSDGSVIRLSLTQAELGALIGAREPTVQVALRELRRDGVIATGHLRIVVRDWAGLHRAAGISEIPAEYGVRPADGHGGPGR